MTKKRRRIPDDELHFYENNIAGASLIKRLVKRLATVVGLNVSDDSVRGAAYEDAKRAHNAADRIRQRNIDRMHRRKDEAIDD